MTLKYECELVAGQLWGFSRSHLDTDSSWRLSGGGSHGSPPLSLRARRELKLEIVLCGKPEGTDESQRTMRRATTIISVGAVTTTRASTIISGRTPSWEVPR